MTNRYYYFLLIPLLAFVTVVGAGFWYVNRGSNASNTLADDNSPRPYIYEPEQKDPDSYESRMERLIKAVKRFREAKSFNATVVELKDGGMSSELSYVKPLRLKADIKVDGKPAFEMIIVGETSYARYPDDEWKMTNDESIRAFGRTFFESMISADATLQSFGIESEASFDIKNNAKDDCLQFATMYKAEESNYPISFCIDEANNIVKLTKTDKDGEVVSTYRDYNALFNIERPVLPLLDPTLQIKYENEE